MLWLTLNLNVLQSWIHRCWTPRNTCSVYDSSVSYWTPVVSTLTAGQARRSSTASLSTFRYHCLFSYIIIYIIPTCFIPTVICSYRICDVMKYLYFVTYLSSLSLCNFLCIEFVLLQVALPIKSISLYLPTKIHTELSITWSILGDYCMQLWIYLKSSE